VAIIDYSNPRLFAFTGSDHGPWRVEHMHCLAGDPLPAVACVEVTAGLARAAQGAAWMLRGATSNERYVQRDEKTELANRQEGLGRPASSCAALIPIRKSPAWWALTQDERRSILEEQSQHIRIGMRYLPAIARRLHHCRDLTTAEPFDFVTWFEYAPDAAPAFDDLLAALRASAEWSFVDREVDIRLLHAAP
jgi:hypothetical protein